MQVADITTLLRRGDKRIGLLLGAGCPMSIELDGQPLIPGISGLTATVKVRLRDQCSAALDALTTVMTDDGTADTVEGMLTLVRQLRSVCGRSCVRGLDSTMLVTLEKEICRAVHEVMTKRLPSRATPYHDLAWWAGSCVRKHPVEVFTTNYDLLVEQAFEESCVPYFDGFVGARHAFFNASAMSADALSTWVRLWKLHGSVNWRRTNEGVIRTDSMTFDENTSLVIHPSHLKYDQSRKMPYLALMDQFRRFLLAPSSTLVVCGYSFGDEHLNDAIADALLSNKTATVFALLWGSIDDYPVASTLAEHSRNLCTLAGDGGIIGARTFRWQEPPAADAASDSASSTFLNGDFAKLAAAMRAIAPDE
jgi:hypothetical protein